MWSRDNVEADLMYALSFVNTLLVEIDKFISRPIPSLLILTTNYPALLDAAFQSRITDVVKLPIPTGKQAKDIWRSKLPKCMLKDKSLENDLEILAASKMTPRKIEQSIDHACRIALLENRAPSIKDIIH